jgi:hypothetical protein
MTSEHATPRHLQALAECIHLVAYSIEKRGRERATTDAAQLRRLADILEGKV